MLTKSAASFKYSGFQPFLYGGILFSYLNFRSTPIILVNNKTVFTENLSMISQLSFQYHSDLKKKKKVFT